MAKRTTKKVDLDFPCFSQLHDFYRLNRGHIRTHYRELSRKFLDFNDPDHNPSGASSLRLEALDQLSPFAQRLPRRNGLAPLTLRALSKGLAAYLQRSN